jgi:predicted ATPase/class 3 adenylate cyclase
MDQREKIEKAIRVLEARRELLGDAVVEVTIAAIRETLLEAVPATAEGDGSASRPVTPAAKSKTATVLVAHVAGLARLTTLMPTDEMTLLANDLWQRLSATVRQEGGKIDRHTAHDLTAVFGLTATHRDEPVRAVRAALAMQALFRSFLEQVVDRIRLDSSGQAGAPPALENGLPCQLHIGLHTGPVQVAHLDSDELTVVGEGVQLAQHLERLVTQSGIFISQPAYHRMADRVEAEPLSPDQHRQDQYPHLIYRVIGLRPWPFNLQGWGVTDVETPLLGRDETLQALQNHLAETDDGQGRLVTVVGEAGMGKSRLAFELGRWARQHRSGTLLLRAKVEPGTRPLPYALVRDLMTTTLNIQDNEPAALVLEKLTAVLRRLHVEEEDLQEQARLLGQLVGLAIVDDPALHEQFDLPADDYWARYRREQAIEAWVTLVDHTIKRWPATLIFLEDLHLADVESLQLLARVSHILAKAPLLMVCLSQVSLFDRLPNWPRLDPFHSLDLPHTTLKLPPLPAEASGQMVGHLLRQATPAPVEVTELVVTRAGGNPLFVEELVKLLVDDGLIVADEQGWRVQPELLSDPQIPATLPELLQNRLSRLSRREQLTLQRASVMGQTFWETAVSAMSDLIMTQAAEQTRSLLQALEQKGFIFRLPVSMFAGTDCYLFKHDLLQQIAYQSIPPRHRPLYHKQVADWLAEQSGERIAEYAARVAYHYDLAGEAVQAAELYELAGRQAQALSNLDTAVDNYRRTLALLTDKPRHTHWLLRLQEQIGPLLLRRLRLVEAAQIYMTLQYTAEIDGELALQAQAWLGLATTQREQADYRAMLQSAQQAQRAARLVTAYAEEVNALLLQSEAHVYRGEVALARERAQEALAISSQMSLLPERIRALSLLAQIHYGQGEQARAQAHQQQLVKLIASLAAEQGFDEDRQRLQAQFHLVLANVYRAGGELALARNGLNDVLQLLAQADNPKARAQTEAALGRLALRQGAAEVAATHLRAAVALARSLGDELGRIRYQLYLVQALLSLSQEKEAQAALHWLLARTGNSHLMEDWWGQLEALDLLVALYLARQQPARALDAARQALVVAQRRNRPQNKAVAWRLLAQALQAMPPPQQSILIGSVRYDVSTCYGRSWQRLTEANQQIPGYRRQAMKTLLAWRDYEAQRPQPSLDDEVFDQRLAELQAVPAWDELY